MNIILDLQKLIIPDKSFSSAIAALAALLVAVMTSHKIALKKS
jgi:hypothetical protein